MSLLLMAFSLLLIVLGWSTPLPKGWTPWLEQAVSMVGVIPAPVLGGLIASRRPENRYGWVWLGFGLSLALVTFAEPYTSYALVAEPGSLPAPRTANNVLALGFYSTSRFASEHPGAEAFGAPPAGVLTWEDVEDMYGVVALLDPEAGRGVSIVPTKERLVSWELECKDFPRAPYGPEIVRGLNERIFGVWPYASPSKDGEFGRGWRCRSLLQAMYLMIYLDFTGGKKVQECARPDCRRYYRLGAHESEYCSRGCTSVMTTRRSRNQ